MNCQIWVALTFYRFLARYVKYSIYKTISFQPVQISGNTYLNFSCTQKESLHFTVNCDIWVDVTFYRFLARYVKHSIYKTISFQPVLHNWSKYPVCGMVHPSHHEQERRKEFFLFNDVLNTFYLRLYGVRHMVKDHSNSERGNPLLPYGLLLSINSKGSFICTIPHTG